MRGDGRRSALGAGRGGVWHVEGGEQARKFEAVDAAVNRATGLAGEQRHRWAADGDIEAAGDGEHRIVERLEFEATTVLLPEQAIFRVGTEAVVAVEARLAVRCGVRDLPVECLHAPTVRHEFRCQPVEEFGVRRRVATEAEVAGRVDQPAAEVVHPNAVDEHAGGEWIILRRHRFRQFKATTS